MDKNSKYEIKKNILKVYKGILVYLIVVSILIFAFGKADVKTIGGLILGCLVSMIALLMIAFNAISLVEKKKGIAVFSATFGFGLRFAMYAAVLIFAAITKTVSFYTVAIGLISSSVTIKLQQLFLKLNSRKEE